MFFKDEKGFNLVEMIFYVGMASLLLLAISSFYIVSRRMEARNILISEVEFYGNRLSRVFEDYFGQETNIYYPAPGQQTNNISLDVATSNDNPFNIYLDNGVVYLQQGSSGVTRLTGQSVIVDELVFENLSKDVDFDLIRFEIKIKTNNISGRQEYFYEKTFKGSVSGRYQ